MSYDVGERVRDMNANGTLASMNFPSFPGFAGTHLARMPDRELTNITVSAYNDWLIDEWAGAAPGRFLPMTLLPFFDVEASVAEIHRVAAKGSLAVTLPETPYGVGAPDYGSGYWDPIFKAMCETGQVGCFHIGGAYGLLKRPGVVDDQRPVRAVPAAHRGHVQRHPAERPAAHVPGAALRAVRGRHRMDPVLPRQVRARRAQPVVDPPRQAPAGQDDDRDLP